MAGYSTSIGRLFKQETPPMKSGTSRIAIAGHICLDIIPSFNATEEVSTAQIKPGQLYLVGPAVRATGGTVSNTGLALHQLGIPVTLMGKIADDLFGAEVLNILRGYHSDLADGMIVTPAKEASGDHTSYSIVISPPDVDRSFLHCPGTNDTFSAKDIDFGLLDESNIFHFGYPPLMRRFYSDGGQQMYDLFSRVKQKGLMTSLDMAMPDSQSAAGQVDWPKWLEKVLPSVDLFLPSIEEILLMLDRSLYDQHVQSRALKYDVGLLSQIADQLLRMGTKVVVLKLGEQGLYLRSSDKAARLSAGRKTGPQLPVTWNDRELLAPCFKVEVVGTTGAGDSTIAGFLAALTNEASPEESLVQAVAVGAYSVEVADATSGICSVSEVKKRIATGWDRQKIPPPQDGWKWDDTQAVWRGPNDTRV